MIATSGVYKLLFTLHILAVVVGFGPWMVAAAFGAKAHARRGAEGLAIAETTYDVIRTYSEWAIYAVPILGILLVATSDDLWKFSQAWVSLSFLLYIVILGVAHGMYFRNLKRVNELIGTAGPSQAAELEQCTRQAAIANGIINVLVVVVIVLMVWKPGAPGS
jgi:uncharacterized membrane protein